MAKANAIVIVFPAVLKTIITHAASDDKTFTRTDKQVRATLRTKLADAHAKNTSWVANNQREYDRIRSAFDGSYATKIAKPKRAPKASKVKADAEPVIA